MIMIGLAAAMASPGAATTLYMGDARITDPFSGQLQTEQVLLVREVTPAQQRIVETACVVHPGRPAITAPVYLTIEGQRVRISDNAAGTGGAVSGSGTVLGEPWAWRELHFDMTYTSPRGSVRIRDVNIMLPNRLLARKEISVAGGPIVQLWEAELPAVAAAQFRGEWARNRCGTLPAAATG